MATDTRTRMLETTARLLQHRGYFGTALSDILEASGAPRGSLYFHFPGGKDQLVIEATRLAVEETSRFLRDDARRGAGPGEVVRTLLRGGGGAARETDYSFGCPVAPVILDAPDDAARAGGDLPAGVRGVGRALPRRASRRPGSRRTRATALALLVEAAMEGLLVIARA